MNLIPHATYTLNSSLAAEEAIERLASHIRTHCFRFASRESALPDRYYGTITGNNFELNRIIRRPNNAEPTIAGKIETIGGHTRVHITIGVPVARRLFFLLIIIVLLLINAAMALYILTDGLNPVALIPAFMLIMAYVPTTIAFNRERKQTMAFLTKLFEATPEL